MKHSLYFNMVMTSNILLNLQTVHQFWERKDVKGVIHAMGMISDHAVCILFVVSIPYVS